MGTQLSSPKGAQPLPQFSANVRCGQTVGWTKMSLGMEVGLGPGDFVFVGDPAPPQKKGTVPTQFLAHVYGQRAGWTKMPLRTEVNLEPGDVGPGDVVLHGDAALPGPCLYCGHMAG